VEEDVAFGLGNLGVPTDEMRARVAAALAHVNLTHTARRSPHELSGGEQQKLCLAGMLAMQPAGLVLDEPLTFLDSRSRQEMLDLSERINRTGMTIISLTSDLETLPDAVTRVILLRNGAFHAECARTELWNDPAQLTRAGIMPAPLPEFRAALRQCGYPLRDDSFGVTAIVEDVMRGRLVRKGSVVTTTDTKKTQ